MNMVISVLAALPAALCLLALSLPCDKHLLLASHQPYGAARGVRAAFFQLYSAFGLIDTHIAVASLRTSVQRAAGGLDP